MSQFEAWVRFGCGNDANYSREKRYQKPTADKQIRTASTTFSGKPVRAWNPTL